MLLIAAALREELEVALELCTHRSPLRLPGVKAWRARRDPATLWLLRTGAGPSRAERALRRFLSEHKPDSILVIGYAGALAPGLAVGSLFMPGRVSFLESPGTALPSGGWALHNNTAQMKRCISAGLDCASGDLLTTPYIIGDPDLKRRLHETLGAAAVDMESAVLARAARDCGAPFYCVRSISDDSADEFLKPFSFDPAAGTAVRAARILSAGRWLERYRLWRSRSEIARASLRKFLTWFLSEEGILQA